MHEHTAEQLSINKKNKVVPPKELEKAAKEFEQFAIKYYLENAKDGKQPKTLVRVYNKDLTKQITIATGWADHGERTKRFMDFLMKLESKDMVPEHAFMSSEAWTVIGEKKDLKPDDGNEWFPKNGKHKMQLPSESPDRQEVFIIVGSSREQQISYHHCYSIERDADKKVTGIGKFSEAVKDKLKKPTKKALQDLDGQGWEKEELVGFKSTLQRFLAMARVKEFVTPLLAAGKSYKEISDALDKAGISAEREDILP